MRTFDRVVLVVLALGIWALVMEPAELTAHIGGHDHSSDCTISGYAEGYNHYEGSGPIEITDWGNVSISCSID